MGPPQPYSQGSFSVLLLLLLLLLFVKYYAMLNTNLKRLKKSDNKYIFLWYKKKLMSICYLYCIYIN